jgi:tetratricopeptide (TPR) repeat protein
MQRRRKSALLLMLFGVLFCAGLLYRETRQNRLDHALLAAIERDDSGAVVWLLAQGANPNTRRTPNLRVSFWRMLLDRLHGRHLPEGPSALQIALKRDFTYELPRHQADSLTIVAALLRSGAGSPAGTKQSDAALDWAGRLLGKVPDRPLRRDDGWDVYQWRWEEAEEAFRDIVLKHGGSARAYAGLGECRLRQGLYASADHAYRLALLWSPDEAAAHTGLTNADALWRVSREAEALLPAGCKVIFVRPYPVETGKTLWAVLYGNHYVEENGPRHGIWNHIHLALYAESGPNLRAIWRSGVLNDTYHDLNEFNALQMFVCRLTGESAPQIVVHEIGLGGSWEPSHIDVFTWRQGRLVSILQVGGSMPLWVEDLKHDGRYEILNAYEIGATMYHAAQPRWSDIYAYRNGRYVQANRDFPEEFTHWLKDLPDTLRRFPNDEEILRFLGEAYEITGHPDRALAAYRRVERLDASFSKIDTDRDVRAYRQPQQKSIRQRIQALERGTSGRE